MPRLALLALLALLVVTGCASVQQYRAEVAKYQAMADRATAALGGGQVRIEVVSGNTGNAGSASCAQGAIRLGRDTPNVEWLLAHELGHHITGHCGQGLVSEMEANAGAIKVLQAWGSSEEYAVRRTEQHLIRLKIYRGDRPLPGHDYCAEYWDLRRRFPQHLPNDPDGDAVNCPGGTSFRQSDAMDDSRTADDLHEPSSGWAA